MNDLCFFGGLFSLAGFDGFPDFERCVWFVVGYMAMVRLFEGLCSARQIKRCRWKGGFSAYNGDEVEHQRVYQTIGVD